MTKESTQDRYLTKDLYEAACLYAKKQKLIGLEPEGNHYLFVFQENSRCQKIADSFWSGDCLVKAKAMADAIRTLKALVFSRR